jgi:nucleoside-diphosphate kinase
MSFEKTVIIIKPDAFKKKVDREIHDKIIREFEDCLYLFGADVPTKELIEQHYDEHKGKAFFKDLVDFMCSGLVGVYHICGKDAIQRGRKLLDEIRLQYANPDIKRENCIHASDSVEAGKRETGIWLEFITKLQ